MELVSCCGWAPVKKIKGNATIARSTNNQPVLQTKPGSPIPSAWKLSIAIPPGIYRVDVLIDGEPQWWEFFHLVD